MEGTDSLQRLQIVVEDLPVALAVLDARGIVREVTGKGRYHAARRPLDEYVGLDAFELLAHDQAAAACLRRTLRTGEHGELLTTVDGVSWFARLRPLHDDRGRPAGVLIAAMDVTRQARAEAARTQAEVEAARFEALVERAFDGSAVITGDGTITYVSAAVRDLVGYDPGALLGQNALDHVHPDDLEAMEAAVDQAAAADHEAPTTECRIVRADGEVRWVEAAVTNRTGDPAIGGIVLNLRDITERKEMQAQLERREAYYRGIVETAQEGVWLVDPDGVTLYANARMAEMLGADLDAMQGASMFDFLPRDARPFWRTNLAQRRRGVSARYEKELRRPDGSTLWIEVSASPLFHLDGELMGAVAMVADITERKRTEVELAHLALHDALTGLANRTLLLDNLGRALQRAGRSGHLVGVLFIDLDNFKFVNDSVGHDAGDQLLRAAAARLQGVVRPGDTVARLGGDEFVIVCEELAEADEAMCLAGRVLEALTPPFALDHGEVFVGASVGIALSPADDAGELVRRADTAMYRAKERGRGRIEVFDEALLEAAITRFRLHSDLREALAKHQLVVHYQPIVRLDDERIVGVEALVRWPHPERGAIGPDQFVPVAEQTGLIRELGLQVLDAACDQVKRWCDRRAEPLHLAVNLSVRHLADPNVVDDVVAALERHRLDPAQLCLELTESALMDDAEQALVALQALHGHGVRFAIDDFGTGYSSLVYLRRFPIAEIKIDRSFIAGLPEDAEDTAIVENIVSLAAAVGARTVAEGVETPEQLGTARRLGCDLAQGYLLHRPVPAEQLDELLGP